MLMSSGEQPAMLVYGPNGFRMVKPGHFVPCAVSGVPIALESLLYWSVELQEAYASPELATRRLLDQA